MKEKIIGFLLQILKIFLIIIAVLVLFNAGADAQTYYSEISENQYNKIIMGDLFYEGQIQLTDGTWHKGWIARFPDSNKLRFRTIEDTTRIFLLHQAMQHLLHL